MLNYKQMFEIAVNQTAIDMNCEVVDLLDNKRKVVISQMNKNCKKYYKENQFCSLSYYGSSLVASVDEKLKGFMDSFINRYEDAYRYFDAPNLLILNNELNKHNYCICNIGEYYLFDPNKKLEPNTNFQYEILVGEEIEKLYTNKNLSNALRYDAKGHFKDEIAVVGYQDGLLAGCAACSNDSDTLWQIGVDVIPSFRGQSLASSLIYILANEIIKRGKVPFYCTAYSNIPSKLSAYKAGFKTAWIEMAAKPIEEAKRMIGE